MRLCEKWNKLCKEWQRDCRKLYKINPWSTVVEREFAGNQIHPVKIHFEVNISLVVVEISCHPMTRNSYLIVLIVLIQMGQVKKLVLQGKAYKDTIADLERITCGNQIKAHILYSENVNLQLENNATFTARAYLYSYLCRQWSSFPRIKLWVNLVLYNTQNMCLTYVQRSMAFMVRGHPGMN